MNQPDVLILMATWNGGAYLEAQLNSLLSQTYQNWHLLVHDDGSSDNTLSILDSFAKKDNRISLLNDGMTGLGASGNFMHLLQHADADYILFCDQDDIWLDDKIAVLVDAIHGISEPALVYTNGYILRNDRVSAEKAIFFHPETLRDILLLNTGIHGCLCLINRELLLLAKAYKGYVVMHDHLVTLLAATFGQIRHVDRYLIHYRMHGKNVTRAYHTGTTKKIINFISNGRAVVDRKHAMAIGAVYAFFKEKIPEEKKKIYRAFNRFIDPGTSLLQRIGLLFQYRFRLGKSSTALLLKTIIRKPINEPEDR